ncbi:MAG TPA: sodium:solute symporter [Gemmatimonadaceae bacterium]|nr:sodium:solute symporter [Gemmatimonadaceae bacterium]
MTPALVVIIGVFVIVIALGLMARRGHVMNLEQWSVGGRGFGTVFVFLLMAGEIYTTFTFLGGSGWAYGKGAPAFYILCYGAIAYSVSYFLLPIIWRYAQTRKLVSQADFFVAKYESKTLGVIVALVSVAALVPYLVLQLKGLGIIVSEASGGVITQAVAVWTSSIALVGYVVVSGVRGSAWTSALKDAMILAVAVGIGVYLPLHYFGGYRAMFEAVEMAKPGALTLPSSGMSPAWFISTVLLTATGFYMWPQFFAGVYTARNENVFRKNAVILPLYQLVVLFVFFTGFAAMLVVPGLKGASADLSLLRIVEQSFGSWTVGVIGAAGLLTALVPGSMILITAGTIISQNIYRVMAPRASDRTVSLVARSLVPVFTLAAVILTLRGGQTLVVLLLMGYNFVTQLFPALILSLGERQRVSAASAIAGIVAGELTVVFLTVTNASVATLLPGAPQVVKDLNVGFVALAVNAVVLTVVALATRVERPVVTEFVHNL